LREYAERFLPGEEAIEDGELRVTVLGSGNPWTTRAQASASILVEVGNAERDILVFDLGRGSLANYASLKLPVNKLSKVFLTHLHADHMGDLITLSGSYAKVGRADGPIAVWGPSGTEPRLGTRHFVESIEEALAWDTAAGNGAINPDSMRLVATEFNFSLTQTVYEKHGVKVTSYPVVHCIGGAVGYRLDFAGLSFAFSGDARPCWPLVRACEGARSGIGSIYRKGHVSSERGSHVADSCRQGVRTREATNGRALAYASNASGHFIGFCGT
jgi:ribonuclease Z